MGIHLAVARLLPPEYLILPDGTKVKTDSLINKVKDKVSYNLRLKLEYGPKSRRKMHNHPDNNP